MIQVFFSNFKNIPNYYNMALSLIFKPEERKLLAKIEESNIDDMVYWKLPNITYPFAVIAFSIICFILFKQGVKFTWAGLLNLLFNGSLPMVALNRMSSMGGNLFKFDKSKEELVKKDTRPLRVKLDDYSKILLIFICIVYVYQVMEGPFELGWFLIFQLVCSVILIYLALVFSKYAYLLQEKLLERTIFDDVMDETKKTKKHLSEKYGN